MAVDETSSVVERGRAQRGGSWPKPGDEGFVHPDGTPQSERQLADNVRAAADREAAASGVHGAPGQGGVQAVPMVDDEPTELAKARGEHTQYVRDGLAALVEATEAEDAPSSAKHEAPVSKSADSSKGS